jgi:AcrR family transcriptional regulator
VGVRAAATAANRRAIIEAARVLLATAEWRDFTLESVAAAAGVTRVTVYNQVGSKQGLLDAVLTELTERWGMEALLSATDEMPATDARAYVVERTCRFWHAERAVLRPLFGLATVDHELAANLAQRERWRSDQYAHLLARLDATADPAALAGVVAVTSFPTYDALGALADDPVAAASLILRLVACLTG